jgi:hypothetical protein
MRRRRSPDPRNSMSRRSDVHRRSCCDRRRGLSRRRSRVRLPSLPYEKRCEGTRTLDQPREPPARTRRRTRARRTPGRTPAGRRRCHGRPANRQPGSRPHAAHGGTRRSRDHSQGPPREANRRGVCCLVAYFADHYNSHRPHGSLDLKLPDPLAWQLQIPHSPQRSSSAETVSADSSTNTAPPREASLRIPHG